MKIIGIFKAQGIAGKEVESVSIVFDQEMPRFESVEQSIKTFESDADILTNILCDTLPGGILDRLIGKLLMKKATAFIVPLFDKKA